MAARYRKGSFFICEKLDKLQKSYDNSITINGKPDESPGRKATGPYYKIPQGNG